LGADIERGTNGGFDSAVFAGLSVALVRGEFGPVGGDPCMCSRYDQAYMSALGSKPPLTLFAAAGQPLEMVRR